MKLWLATRKDRIGYDEYDGFVVRAKSRQSALKIIKAEEKETSSAYGIWKISVVKEEGTEEVVLEAFNTG